MRDLKKFTATKIRQEVEKYAPEKLSTLFYQKGNQLFKVWATKFDELYLVSRPLLEVKLNYIHNNPLQNHWNLVDNPQDYLYSSASFYLAGKQNSIQVSHYMDYV